MTDVNVVAELDGCRPNTIDDAVLTSTEPLFLKGLVTDWPIVKAGRQSAQATADYILQFYSGEPVTAAIGPPSIKGRVAYNDDLTGFNFDRSKVTLDVFLERLLMHVEDPDPPAYYVGSTVVDRWLPGFRDANDLVLNGIEPLTSIWIGNQIRVSAHFDVTDNIACSVAGRRRFTLFPPDQIDNLYI